MSSTLATVQALVETNLLDSSNYIYPEVLIQQAIRTSLAEISTIYGAALLLEDLDAAASTTILEVDVPVLVLGSTVYCLVFRISQRYEEASPVREQIDDLVKAKDKVQDLYQDQIYQIKLRKFQESTDHPHSEWDWVEGDGFT